MSRVKITIEIECTLEEYRGSIEGSLTPLMSNEGKGVITPTESETTKGVEKTPQPLPDTPVSNSGELEGNGFDSIE